MGRFQRSIELGKASWRTLKKDRELLALPLMSFVVAAIVLGIAGGLVFLAEYDSATGWENFEMGPAGIIILVLAGILMAVVSAYFQAAMVSGATERLTGGDPTVGSALSAATARLGVIVPWALFVWTVGAVLRLIEEKLGPVGRFLGAVGSMAFRVVTFLAIPIVVMEQQGPIDTFKRSTELFRQTWGENLAAQLGLGLFGFIAVIPGILVGVLLAASGTQVLVFAGIALAVLWIAAVTVVMTSLTATYQAALYQYATTNEVPVEFAPVDFPTAFEPKS